MRVDGIAIAIIIAAGGLVTGAAGAAAQGAPRAANGAACTIVGTAAADTLYGTRANDVSCGLGGNDRIAGGAGRDTVDGGAGADRLDGGDGVDLVLGGNGTDQVAGGPGADRVAGGDGADTLVVTAVDLCVAPAGDTMVGSCAVDAAGPAIAEVSLPAQITAGSELVVTWRITDAAGVGLLDDGGPATWMQIGGAPGWLSWCGFQVPATRIAGDALDGTYRATCLIPTGVPNDQYGIHIGAYDLAGTTTPATERGTFRIAGGTDDTAPPVVTSVAIEGAIPGPGGTLVLTWRAADPSGIDYVLPWIFGPNGLLVTQPNGEQWFGMPTSPVRTSGDATDGRYRQELPASTLLAPGTYKVWFSGRDLPGNRFYDGGPSGTGYLTFAVSG